VEARSHCSGGIDTMMPYALSVFFFFCFFGGRGVGGWLVAGDGPKLIPMGGSVVGSWSNVSP
jgi:hypothetical protein